MSSCLACGLDPPSADLEFCPRCGGALRDPLVGVLLGERYRIIERIGVGGMGAVYRAVHTALKRDVAIKVLLPDLGGRDEFARRFEREAESASRLAHPNIIAITDFGRTSEGLLFLVMEFLDGKSLTSLIKQRPLELTRALHLMQQILSALGHAHAAGVVHRDLKPDNIMLVTRHGRTDVVKILDFGIAKVTDGGAAATHEALTQAGMIFGTPEYLSPEQALGDTVDARADLYAAGVILFEMLTGRRPFESPDKVRIISMHLSHSPPQMAEVNAAVNIPPSIEDVVRQALEKERGHRFASATAFLAALADAEAEVQGQPVPALVPPPTGFPPGTPSGVTPLVVPASRRFRWARWGAPAAAALAVALVAFLVLGGRSPRPGTVATGRLTQPAPPPPSLAARVRFIEGLLASGEIIKARVAVEQVLAENPANARVHYLRGRLAFADDHHGEALDDYREAITLDPGFRGDPILIDHLGTALGEAKVADAALDLAIEKVGRPAADLLERVANGPGELRRRQRAAQALAELGEERRVDQVSLRGAALKKATTCEEKKPLVIALGNTEDPRALPALRSQRSRGGLEGLFRGAPDTSCMKAELADAIAKLEAKLPPEKRTSERERERGPGRKPASRTSIFRGR